MSAKIANELLYVCAPRMRKISEMMIESEDMQWQAPPGTSFRLDSLVTDPTGEAASDARRLAVRKARRQAVAALERASVELARAAVELERSVQRWYGE